MSPGLLETLGEILDRSEEPDDALRAVVAAIAEEPRVKWAGIAFLDEGNLVLGPAAGEPDDALRTRIPIVFQGSRVGELWIDGETDRASLEGVAPLLAGHVLIGWDTRGETWNP